MALFHDLGPLEQRAAREEVSRQETVVRGLLLDVVRRSTAFLFVLLLTSSIALLAAGVHFKYHAPLLFLALIAFLLGLLCLGMIFLINRALLVRLVVNFAWLRFKILDSQVDTGSLNAPPPDMPKSQRLAVAFGYAALIFWVLGATLGVSAFAGNFPAKIAHSNRQNTESTAVPEHHESKGLQAPANQSALALADEIGIGVLAAGLIQAGALIWTILLARKTAQRQLRAYVGPDTADLVSGSVVNPPNPARADEPGAVLICKNTGQTPAYKVRIHAQVAVIEPKSESSLVVPQLQAGQYSTLGTNVVSRNLPVLGRNLTAQEIADIHKGVRAIYLYGRVEYLDTFNKRRFTAFRLFYTGAWPLTGPAGMTFAAQGNDAD